MRSTDSGVDPSRAPLARHADSADSNAEEGAGAEEPPPPPLPREEEPPLEEDPPLQEAPSALSDRAGARGWRWGEARQAGEARAAGLANLACAGVGGALANHSALYVGALRRAAGGADRSRRVAAVALVLTCSVLLYGVHHCMDVLPRFIIGGLLLALGLYPSSIALIALSF